MNKIIAFTNQKGGVGKSTICRLMASYLASKGERVCVIDTDSQQTLVLQRKDDIEFLGEEVMPYTIQSYKINTYELMEQLMENAKAFDGYVLIDCPPSLDADGLIPILTKSDCLVCPFRYDTTTLTSTGNYIRVLRSLFDRLKQPLTPIYFIPNNIVRKGSVEEKKVWHEVAKAFSILGILLPSIPGRAVIEKVNTYEITSQQRELVSDIFETIIKDLKV